jgi:hypothetical protein
MPINVGELYNKVYESEKHSQTCAMCISFDSDLKSCPRSIWYLIDLIDLDDIVDIDDLACLEDDDDLVKLRTELDIYLTHMEVTWQPITQHAKEIQQIIVKTVYKFREIVFPVGKYTKAARH